jgi:hypothetical protein
MPASLGQSVTVLTGMACLGVQMRSGRALPGTGFLSVPRPARHSNPARRLNEGAGHARGGQCGAQSGPGHLDRNRTRRGPSQPIRRRRPPRRGFGVFRDRIGWDPSCSIHPGVGRGGRRNDVGWPRTRSRRSKGQDYGRGRSSPSSIPPGSSGRRNVRTLCRTARTTSRVRWRELR